MRGSEASAGFFQRCPPIDPPGSGVPLLQAKAGASPSIISLKKGDAFARESCQNEAMVAPPGWCRRHPVMVLGGSSLAVDNFSSQRNSEKSLGGFFANKEVTLAMDGQKAGFCNRCDGAGLMIEPRGRHAEARVCECSEVCHTCHGARFIFEKDAARREVAEMCECEVLRTRIRWYNEARIPGKFYDARLSEQFRDRGNQVVFNTFKLLATDYSRGHKGVVLMGPSGVGKTFLVAAFLYEIIFAKGVPAAFRDFSQLLADLRSGYSQDRPELEVIGPLVEVELLVVDELGKGRNTPWELNVLDGIISQRYNNRKTTVFTSNYTESRSTTLAERVRGKDVIPGEGDVETRDTLKDRVGARIHSRLREMCDFVTLLGPDRRDLEPEANQA